MAVAADRHIVAKAKVGPEGVRIEVGAEELARAGVQPGEHVVVDIRRYTSEDWFEEGEDRVFTGGELLAYLAACPHDSAEDA